MAACGESRKRKRALPPTETQNAKDVDVFFRDPEKYKPERLAAVTQSTVTGRTQSWRVLHAVGLTQEDDTKPCVCIDAASWILLHDTVASLQQQLDDCRSELEELRLEVHWHPDRATPALQLHFETLAKE